jgi:hypothetical protein
VAPRDARPTIRASVDPIKFVGVIAVVGYLLAAGVAIFIALIAAGPRHTVRRDETLDAGELAGRQVSIFSSLAGFAATGIVLLVTLSRDATDLGGTAVTTILAMFVVAYMGMYSVSVQLSNVSSRTSQVGFDLGAAQLAGATISQYYLFFGWLALRPLFDAFGLTQMAELVTYLLIAAVAVGYGPLASVLQRTGFATIRMIVLMPLIATGVTAAYVLLLRISGVGRVPDGTLALILVGFIPGALAHAGLTFLPILARMERLSAILADRAHLLILGYAQAVMVLVYFLLLSVVGLI